MQLIKSNGLLTAFAKCAEFVLAEGIRKSDMSEVQDLVCEIKLLEADIVNFKAFVDRLSTHELLAPGFEKALRAYRRPQGNITKPSYIGRLLRYPFLQKSTNDWSPIDQFEVVLEQFEQAPQSSNLGMIVFHPHDIRDAFRPGYVPCLSFIDIKYRAGELRTKFYFRSCDFAEVALFDFYHCIELHERLLASCKARRPDLEFKKQRVLINFSRAFTYNRKRAPLRLILAAANEQKQTSSSNA